MITVSDYGTADLGMAPRATKPDVVFPMLVIVAAEHKPYIYEHVLFMGETKCVLKYKKLGY